MREIGVPDQLSLTKIPVRQLKILILNPLSLLVYNKNMSAYYMYIVVGMLQLGISIYTLQKDNDINEAQPVGFVICYIMFTCIH